MYFEAHDKYLNCRIITTIIQVVRVKRDKYVQPNIFQPIIYWEKEFWNDWIWKVFDVIERLILHLKNHLNLIFENTWRWIKWQSSVTKYLKRIWCDRVLQNMIDFIFIKMILINKNNKNKIKKEIKTNKIKWQWGCMRIIGDDKSSKKSTCMAQRPNINKKRIRKCCRRKIRGWTKSKRPNMAGPKSHLTQVKRIRGVKNLTQPHSSD